MPQVIIQPAGNQGGREHYRDTIETPVPLARIARHVDPAFRQQLSTLFSDELVPTWGVTPGVNGVNERKWQRIGNGDVALFLKEGHAYAAGTVASKARSSDLARDLWGANDKGETWEFVYFLKDVRPVDVSYAELNRLLGYESANQFQGFNVVANERSAALLQHLGVAAPTTSELGVRYWWVNQGSSFRQERDGGFVWAPKTNKSGVALRFHTSVGQLRLGDVVLHYANGIRAVGTVSAPPTDAKRPSDLPSEMWGEDGRIARVSYRVLNAVIPLERVPYSLRKRESENSSGPFTRDASVKLGYLFPLTDEFVAGLFERFPELKGDDVMEVDQSLTALIDRATHDFERAGLQFERDAIGRFAASLLAKPFVILTGLSGSGKTKLAQGFANWLGCTADSGRCRVVAVGPDWTSKESALGYPNALNPAEYQRTPALDLILQAATNPNEPFFLILDEMNLSHVERYFADILSAMESGEAIDLHAGPDERQGVPPTIRLPRNLYIVGTVNVDETTYMFSPKVLDRAHVLEFRASREQVETVVRNGRRPELSLLAGLGSHYAQIFTGTVDADVLPDLDEARLTSELALFFDVLEHEGYEFGYRTAIETTEFLRRHRQLAGHAWRFDDAFDAEVLQKLLPRIHGSQRQIEGILRALVVLCFEARSWSPEGHLLNRDTLAAQASEAAALTDRDWDPLNNRRDDGNAAYPRSLGKVRRMLHHLDRNGFTSFAEA